MVLNKFFECFQILLVYHIFDVTYQRKWIFLCSSQSMNVLKWIPFIFLFFVFFFMTSRQKPTFLSVFLWYHHGFILLWRSFSTCFLPIDFSALFIWHALASLWCFCSPQCHPCLTDRYIQWMLSVLTLLSSYCIWCCGSFFTSWSSLLP